MDNNNDYECENPERLVRILKIIFIVLFSSCVAPFM